MKAGGCARFCLETLCVFAVAFALYGCASASKSGGRGNTSPAIASLTPNSGAVGAAVTIAGANFGSTQGASTVTFNGIVATATAWSATSVTATVPLSARSGNVVVTVGGLASNSMSFTVTATPTVSSLNPTSGPVGTTVTITGTDFGATQATSTITFNGAIATVTSWSATSISTSVPSGATTGNVVVTVGGQASNGVNFTVTSSIPNITSLNPNSGLVGTTVVITGSNFGATQGTSAVTFNGTAATATNWSATSISTTVPTGATTGNVVVTVGTQTSNAVNFTVVVPAPTITALNPTSAAIGTSVIITGANFGATQDTNSVTFNGTTATVSSWSASSITATVPAGATTGNVFVTVGGQGSNGVSFTVQQVPIKLVQHGSADNGSSSTGTVTVTLNGVASGDLLTCSLTFGNAGGTTLSVSDNLNGPWSIANAAHFNPVIGQTTGQFYFANSKAGNTTITGTPVGPAEFGAMNCQEWSGAATSGPLDLAAQQDGTTANPSSGNVTTTTAGELILGALENVVGPMPGSGFSLIDSTQVTLLSTEYQIQQSASLIAGTWTSPAANWTAQVAAFKPVGAGGGGGSSSPSITGLSPASGAVGTSVTITGANFGATQGTSTVIFNGVVTIPTSWGANSIVAPVPVGAATGNVIVTVNGAASNGVAFTVLPSTPTITSLNPNSGAVGTSVIISGTNFGATQGTSTVKFNGTTASPTSWSATSITVPVPAGASTGNVIVTEGGTASNVITFTITTSGPTISSLSQMSGAVGTAVTIIGTNFGSAQGTSKVTFNGVAATPTSWNATSINATVPAAATTGNVVVTVGGLASNGVAFTVIVPAPTITALNPNTSAVGTAVIITGTNFGATQGTSTVKFNGTAATATAWSATSITATVPSGATTGNVVVTVGTQASNGVGFTVTLPAPAITALNPNAGAVGAAVIIAGTNFGAMQGTSTVKFNGTAATGTAWSATSITAIVPSGATTGNVVVTVGTQTSNGVTFTVSTAPAPTITSLNPTSGAVGTSVTVTGTNFGVTQGTSTVNFNGTAATPTSWSATSISVAVPTGATTGSVIVTVAGAASNAVTFTVSSGSITLTISPRRAGLTVGQSLPVTATTNDGAGVSWTATDGNFNATTGLAVTYTAPPSAGTYTITATSLTDKSKTASSIVGVTNLAGVTTYHNNLSRDGTNPQEYALTTNNVTSASFGKLFSCTIDAPAYAQPLWVANLGTGGSHNVVFVASVHDTVYAFDADKSPCATYWPPKSLLQSGETYLTNGDVASGDIEPDIGIIGTPVIDLSSKTLYVVSKSKDIGTSCTPSSSCHQRLHALSLIDGSEKFGGPYNLTSSITVPGTGDGSSNGSVPFDPLHENQRPGLALVNGIVYISWASHGDNGPYHGWVIGFAANNIGAGPSSVWNSTPNLVSGFSNSDGGIWMSGGAPAADSSNDLYFLTGNGSFDANSGGSNYGDSTIRLTASGGLHVKDYFTPWNQGSLNMIDADHGAGGAAVLVDPSSGPVPHLLIGGGKSGTLFMVNRDGMGGYDDTSHVDHVVQSLSVGSGIFATPAFWNNTLYIAGVNGHLNQYALNTTTGQFALSHASSHFFGFPGSTPSISSAATSDGIVWALDNSQYCTEQSKGCGPAVLHAYDATNVSTTELWNSSTSGGDNAGNAVKFTVPTVANGKVYVPTRTELTVYGLKP